MDPDQTAQAGLDPCWSQTHYVGFVMTRLKYKRCVTIYSTFIYGKPSLRSEHHPEERGLALFGVYSKEDDDAEI
jgi:hypothetical protein